MRCPGMEDGDEATHARRQSLVGGDFFAQRTRARGKEQVVRLLGDGAKKQPRSSLGSVKVTRK